MVWKVYPLVQSPTRRPSTDEGSPSSVESLKEIKVADEAAFFRFSPKKSINFFAENFC
ncbi:hypothetical protein [Lihuaxuella thermophila]|uniref:hypothetical protein n=1 Tax=Lihuaxuella thermophila TaxID=1173111 RepID=UPI00147AB66A|nr:hypothetical protein [Lihuaxuella thermophila]